MVSAKGVLRHEGFRYALDNGAWTAYQAGEPFDVSAFLKALALLGHGADWVVLPDIVGGGMASLDMSLRWMPTVLSDSRMVLLPVQDGMESSDIASIVGPNVGIFVGGTTDWKLRTMPEWGRLGRSLGAYVHVGRVNSVRRIRAVVRSGADSFDGSSVSRYAVTLPKLDFARRQMGLWALSEMRKAG